VYAVYSVVQVQSTCIRSLDTTDSFKLIGHD
jgi:hypothetical protein